MEDKGSISIFQGPTVEADAVHDYLAQNGIGALVRNHMQENLGAGWVTAEADHAAEVFVAREDAPTAKDLMRNLYTDSSANSVPPTTDNKQQAPPTVPPRSGASIIVEREPGTRPDTPPPGQPLK